MTDTFLFDGPADAATTILLAHGAGAPMDSASLNATAKALAEAGFRVARFEFGYMASRRSEAGRRPPPRADTLNPEYKAAVKTLNASGRLIIGGKSMGGRVASMVADELFAAEKVAGLLCLGYPFHPRGNLISCAQKHLITLKTPTLICQGTRDEFGTRDEVPGYGLPDTIRVFWMEDGDHDLKPRKGVSGFSVADHLKTLAKTVADWAATLAK